MGGHETMTEKRFTLNYEINNYEDFMVKDNQKEKILYDEDIEKLLNEQDQKIKELENIIQKLVIELFKPPCPNNDDKYEVLNKFLNEELNIRCIEVDIDIEK